jgi:hypothetical protein
LQPEAVEIPEGDDANKNVDITGDDVQMKNEATERQAGAEMSAMEVPAADIPAKAEILHQPEV